MITPERVYLHHRDLLKRFNNLSEEHDLLKSRFAIMEHFIKERFPEFFAGEVGTIADPTLNPIEIVYGEPEEK